MCDSPDVDDSIGFFDGFDKKTVGITYGVLIGFTLVWQVYVQCVRKPKIDKEWKELVNENTSKYLDSMHDLYRGGGSGIGTGIERQNIN